MNPRKVLESFSSAVDMLRKINLIHDLVNYSNINTILVQLEGYMEITFSNSVVTSTVKRQKEIEKKFNQYIQQLATFPTVKDSLYLDLLKDYLKAFIAAETNKEYDLKKLRRNNIETCIKYTINSFSISEHPEKKKQESISEKDSYIICNSLEALNKHLTTTLENPLSAQFAKRAFDSHLRPLQNFKQHPQISDCLEFLTKEHTALIQDSETPTHDLKKAPLTTTIAKTDTITTAPPKVDTITDPRLQFVRTDYGHVHVAFPSDIQPIVEATVKKITVEPTKKIELFFKPDPRYHTWNADYRLIRIPNENWIYIQTLAYLMGKVYQELSEIPKTPVWGSVKFNIEVATILSGEVTKLTREYIDTTKMIEYIFKMEECIEEITDTLLTQYSMATLEKDKTDSSKKVFTDIIPPLFNKMTGKDSKEALKPKDIADLKKNLAIYPEVKELLNKLIKLREEADKITTITASKTYGAMMEVKKSSKKNHSYLGITQKMRDILSHGKTDTPLEDVFSSKEFGANVHHSNLDDKKEYFEVFDTHAFQRFCEKQKLLARIQKYAPTVRFDLSAGGEYEKFIAGKSTDKVKAAQTIYDTVKTAYADLKNPPDFTLLLQHLRQNKKSYLYDGGEYQALIDDLCCYVQQIKVNNACAPSYLLRRFFSVSKPTSSIGQFFGLQNEDKEYDIVHYPDSTFLGQVKKEKVY